MWYNDNGNYVCSGWGSYLNMGNNSSNCSLVSNSDLVQKGSNDYYLGSFTIDKASNIYLGYYGILYGVNAQSSYTSNNAVKITF